MKPELNISNFSHSESRSNEEAKNETESYNEELPDGCCFSRVLQIHTFQRKELHIHSTVLECEYMGSFLVSEEDHAARAEFVKTQLHQMKVRVNKRPVILLISISGVKVCSPDRKSVLMGHALRRISFATCDPDSNQFSFLAREPNAHVNHQYCHSFLTSTADQAEELSRVVGASFRMAYAQQFAQPLSGSSAVVFQTPTEAQLLRKRSSASSSVVFITSPPALRSPTCDVSRTSPRIPRATWAKKVAGKTEHLDPMAEHVSEMTKKSSSASKSASARTSMANERSRMNHLGDSKRVPGRLPIVQCPQQNGDSSSEENNSPTNINSCKQMKDKPPMLKNVDVVHQGYTAENNFATAKLIARPSSGGYINEESPWEASSCSGFSSECEGRNPRSSGHNSEMEENTSFAYSRGAQLSRVHYRESPSGGCSKRSSRSSSRNKASHNPPPPSFEEVQNATHDRCPIRERSSRSAHGRRTSVSPPPIPERYDSLSITLIEEKELKRAPWFQAGIPREIALEILNGEPTGSFMVRESTSKPGCFALSLRVPEDFQEVGIAHYLIMRTHRGYKIKGFMKEFPTLTALITHHSVMPELLPCPLSLSKHNQGFKKSDSDDMVDMSDDPDYNMLSDFRKMFSDVNS